MTRKKLRRIRKRINAYARDFARYSDAPAWAHRAAARDYLANEGSYPMRCPCGCRSWVWSR